MTGTVHVDTIIYKYTYKVNCTETIIYIYSTNGCSKHTVHELMVPIANHYSRKKTECG